MARMPNGSGREVDSQHLQKLHDQQDEFVRLIQAKKEYIGDLQVQYQKENEGIEFNKLSSTKFLYFIIILKINF